MAISKYEGECPNCDSLLRSTHHDDNYSPKKLWVKCGGETGCGYITALPRKNVGSPDTDPEKTAVSDTPAGRDQEPDQ